MFSRSGTVTVANNVSGNGDLTQAGLGTVVLTGTNTYTGGTYIDGGTLQLAGGPDRLPVGTAVTLRTGVLDLNGNNQAIGSLNYVESSSGGGFSAVALGTATLSIGDGTDSDYAFPISGSGSLVKTGSGTLTLTGSSTYSADTTVSGGTLQIGDGTSGHDGSLATSGVTDNAALVYDVFAVQTAKYPISGNGSLTKAGPGILILSGADSYSGGTTVAAGTLEVLSGSALPTGTSLTLGARGTFVFDPSQAGSPVVGSAVVAAVPEPGMLALLAAAVCGVALYRSVRSRRQKP
jgi:fibronectin-binding autotransporter adhesin